MHLYVVNVGVNASDAAGRGLRSPIFPDGTFEFVPIKEHRGFAGVAGIPRYCDLPCETGRRANLAAFLPARLAGYRAHADPEFVTWTYGDLLSPRASNLKDIEPDDELWFLARLWDHDEHTWTGGSDFYFIARLDVQANLLVSADTDPAGLPDDVKQRLRCNAHYKRWILAGDTTAFRVITGHPCNCSRFARALRVTPSVAAHLYGGAYDPRTGLFHARSQTLMNRNGRPRRFEHFGSVTRSVQVFLDSANPDHKNHIAALRKLVPA